MLGGKSVWLIMVLITVEGCYCSNSTQANTTLGTTLPDEQTPVVETTTFQNPILVKKISVDSTNLSQTNLEIIKIFHGEHNNTTTTTTTTTTEQIIVVNTTAGIIITTDGLNITVLNETSQNDANYTITGAVASSEDAILPFRLPNWAAIVAGVCLVSAVIGYISCVSYRRFLQRKYGNSQILIGEDVYDTSDLRNFEI